MNVSQTILFFNNKLSLYPKPCPGLEPGSLRSSYTTITITLLKTPSIHEYIQ